MSFNTSFSRLNSDTSRFSFAFSCSSSFSRRAWSTCKPPETSGELLKLRELQRKYREIAASIKNEIVKLG